MYTSTKKNHPYFLRRKNKYVNILTFILCNNGIEFQICIDGGFYQYLLVERGNKPCYNEIVVA